MTDPPTESPEHDDAGTATVPKSGPLRFARMAAPRSPGATPPRGSPTSSTPRTTGVRVEERDVDDLRLAFCVLTTYWYRKGPGRRLRLDGPARVPQRVRAPTLRHGRSPRAAR